LKPYRTQWFADAQEKILEDVRRQNDNQPFSTEELAESQQAMKLLSTSADTKGTLSA